MFSSLYRRAPINNITRKFTTALTIDKKPSKMEMFNPLTCALAGAGGFLLMAFLFPNDDVEHDIEMSNQLLDASFRNLALLVENDNLKKELKEQKEQKEQKESK
jgi:hypothetical protein